MSLRAVCSKGQGLLFNKAIACDGVFSERASWYHGVESANLQMVTQILANDPVTLLSQTLAELVHTAYAVLAVRLFALSSNK